MRSKLSGTLVVTHVRRVGEYIVLGIGGFVVLPLSGELIYDAYVVLNGSPRSLRHAICSHAGTILHLCCHKASNGVQLPKLTAQLQGA